MSYCINPKCRNRHNPNNFYKCQACGNDLLIQGQYRLVKPLRDLDLSPYFDVFEAAIQTQPVFPALAHVAALFRKPTAKVTSSEPKVLKVLKKNDHEKYTKLFKQEAEILTNLRHPGIPKAELDDSFPWRLKDGQQLQCLVMEKIEGDNLEDWVRQNGKISEQLALDWLKEITEILDYVHQNNFFHRDIKPSNIMRKPDGKLALIDFGTAREVTETVVNRHGGVTRVESFIYTPQEQIEGRAVPQSDFFALGRTFVYLLIGHHPTPNYFHQNPQTNQLIWRENAPQVSKPLADFIDALMAPSVENRPANTQTILQRLEEIGRSLHQQNSQTETLPPPLQPSPNPPVPRPSPRPIPQSRSRVIVGLIVILLLGVLIWPNQTQSVIHEP
ncbi:serine/threonine protein kinase [Fischerella sp. PCC 9605]|uniref:serine/threonine protein kinase n=1 Tax=Fischerella sp. PCC 9605 TaxID=1173024 RepID=UPI0004ADF220|nr:serine/threonine-protein kinase [Fischerella sp. PCC 9605]